MGIAGEGDDEDIALFVGELEVADVARVDDVEDAVAVDDGFAGAAGVVALGAEGLEVHDFAVVGVAGFAGGEIGHGRYIGRGGGVS